MISNYIIIGNISLIFDKTVATYSRAKIYNSIISNLAIITQEFTMYYSIW